MADRKAPETKPVVNDDEKATSKEAARDRTTTELGSVHLDAAVRYIKTTTLDKAEVVRTLTYNALKRLGARRNKKKAVAGIPKGSRNFDVGSFKAWLEGIHKKDKAAVQQVVALDATCVARWE